MRRIGKLLIFLAIFIALSEPAFCDTLARMTTIFRALIGEQDTASSIAGDSVVKFCLNQAQDNIVKMAGYLPKQQDIIVNLDSLSYRLDGTFKYETGVVVRYNGEWRGVARNDAFAHDTSMWNYSIRFKHADSALLYLRGTSFSDGDTVRVFYNGRAPRMNQGSDSCYVPYDHHPDIYTEAMGIWLRAKQNYQGAAAMWQQVRIDVGAIKPTEGQK